MTAQNVAGIDASFACTSVSIAPADNVNLWAVTRHAAPKAKVPKGEKPPKENSPHPSRLIRLRDGVRDDLLIEGVSFAMIEGYAYGKMNKREMMGELGGALRVAMFEAGIPYAVVPPTTLKKYVTSKGNAKKDLMLLEVYRRWGVHITDDNDADSYGLMRLAAEFVVGRPWSKKMKALAETIEVISS